MPNTYILTTNSLNILTQTNDLWNTSGEYENDCFKIIICEIPEGKEVDYIEASGEVSAPEEFYIEGKTVICGYIYRNATVIFKDIPEAD